jgi:hypothetical protein
MKTLMSVYWKYFKLKQRRGLNQKERAGAVPRSSLLGI